MPVNNAFQHQSYPTSPTVAPLFRTLEAIEGTTGEFAPLHTLLKVGRVVLVHGTFMGDDPLGLSETLIAVSKAIPKIIAGPLEKLAENLRQKTPELIASAAKDIGNYTPEYQAEFQRLVGDDPQVELLSPKWTSQNHPLARADLAVLLLHQMLQRPPAVNQRILFWGHSHAGAAFAILTNLLANDRAAVARFFEAAGEQPGIHWAAVRQALVASTAPHPLSKSVICVTFGTPVRYGWDTSGTSGLLHVIHHRPHTTPPSITTKPLFPPYQPAEMFNATFGDWVQAFAIAGTDTSTLPSHAVNEKLAAVLETNLPEPEHDARTQLIKLTQKRLGDACARWKLGTRCHSDGLNILTNYQPSGQKTLIGAPIENSLLGHGVYTTLKWLPAHLKLVVESLSQSADTTHG